MANQCPSTTIGNVHQYSRNKKSSISIRISVMIGNKSGYTLTRSTKWKISNKITNGHLATSKEDIQDVAKFPCSIIPVLNYGSTFLSTPM